ncbi:MAG: TetR/AcrR family transcriptional regulator [Clostridiales bacterium]|jgi:AcrR family transcriptional regulator|nr:TetR/AcrR family transcriptional regulator [Clostridiales bacterium]
MNGYEKRTNIKKEAIINAARELFAARGVQSVSIHEIAKLANVSQVSIYNYFGDKNSLAKEVFISCIEAAISKYAQIIECNIPFAEKIELIMQDKSNIVSEIALSHFDEQALNDKILRQIFQEVVKEKAASLYQSFIELGKKEGVIDKDIPSEAVMCYFMMSMSIFQRSDFLATSDDYKTGMMKLFLYGLIGNKN